MKLVPVILVSLVLVACLQVSSCANSSLIPSPNRKLPFPTRSDAGIEIYYIKGILNGQKVMYPAVLIRKHMLVAATGDPLESPMICLGDDCTPPKQFVLQRRHYAFWVKNTSNNNTIVPEIFTGSITSANCTLNDRNVITTFRHIAKSKNVYTCIGQCAAHDVVVCYNKVAGFLEKTNKPSAFIFRDITNILQDYSTIRNVGYHTAHVKLFTVKFCGSDKNKEEQTAFAAVAIDANTLVSYRWIDISGNKVKVCGRTVCFTPSGILRRSPYIFWKTDKEVSENTIRFFRGDITKARCSLNGITHNVTFKSFSATKREFTCHTRCRQSDFVLCNGKIAGFLTETLIKNVFKVDTMARVMKFAGHFTKIKGMNRPRRPKLGRQKRRLKPNDAPITTRKVHVPVTQAGNKSYDQPNAAFAPGGGGGGDAAAAPGSKGAPGGVNAPKEKERKNLTSGEKHEPSKVKDGLGSEDVQTSESKRRKGSPVTKNISGKESKPIRSEDDDDEMNKLGPFKVGKHDLRGMEGDDEEEQEINPPNQEGQLPYMSPDDDEDDSEVERKGETYMEDDEEEEDMEEVSRIDGRIPEDEGGSGKEEGYDQIVGIGPSKRTEKPVDQPDFTVLPHDGSTDEVATLKEPETDISVRDTASLADTKASCILINVPVAIVFLFVNV